MTGLEFGLILLVTTILGLAMIGFAMIMAELGASHVFSGLFFLASVVFVLTVLYFSFDSEKFFFWKLCQC